MRLLAGHKNTIRTLAWSPDGRLLASAGDDARILLWDPATGACTAELEGHRRTVRALAFGPDGATLLSGADDGAVLLWDVESRAVRRSLLREHSARVSGAAFDPAGDWAAVGLEFGHPPLAAWNPVRGQAVALPSPVVRVWSLALSPDGHTLGVGLSSGPVVLYDTRRWTEGLSLPHTVAVRSLAFSSDGRTLVTAPGTPLFVWDLEASGGPAVRGQLGEPRHLIESVSFHPDGRTLAAGCWDSSVRIYDVAACAELARYDFQLGRVFAVAVSPDGMTAAAGGDRPEVILVDIDV
jgi:WD40 repeat protein